MRKVSYVVGLIESIGLAIYALTIFISSQTVQSKVGSPVIETAIYFIFGLLIFFTSRGFKNAKTWARTPYLVTQLFMFVTAYTLIAGTTSAYKISGVIVGLLGAVGLYGLVKSPMEN